MGLIILLAACQTSVPVAPPLAGEQSSTGPLAVVESYLRLYQPGPLPRVFQTTRLYDRHGALLAELFEEGRRTWAPLDQISQYLVDATIATEDASFYQNSGIDPLRIAAAFVRNLQQGEVVSGASTITMQLARNLFLGADQRFDQSLDRKILEAGLAQELTERYSKDDLLEMYLNLLNYGNLAYGPEAAAQLYFGKSAAELSLAEATLLAGIPQAPALLDPYTNLETVKARQRVVLDLMVRHGRLSQREAEQVFAQSLTIQEKQPAPPNLAPHFVQYIVETWGAELGGRKLARSGLQITTTLDLSMQQLAQGIVRTHVDEARPQFDLNNAALVAMRPNSGEILVMVGSADFANAEIAGQVNVTTRLRQPGSAIKPVLYATALNDNLVSPATVLWDVPATYDIGNGRRYTPRNYDEKFHGPVTVRWALANSYNVATVKLLDALGVGRMLQSARAMGIHSLDQPVDWYGLSLTLGGGDVTLLDLTTAYHTLASEGRYLPPRAILQMRNHTGEEVRLGDLPAPLPVLTLEATFLVTDILSDNVARAPMFGASNLLQLSRPAAAKTGTTTDYRDNWTLGYTRYLVTGVWAGNSDGHPMRNTSGLTGAAPIWHDFMQAVLDDPHLLAVIGAPAEPEAWRFVPPPGVEQRPDCPPGVQCRSDGEYFAQDWLIAAGEAGPLVDSTEQVSSAPVYVNTPEGMRRAGFCQLEGAAERSMLRTPGRLGLLTPAEQLVFEHGENAANLFADLPDDLAASTEGPTALTATPPTSEITASDPVWQERMQALAWALRTPTPVNLGRCDWLNELAQQTMAQLPEANLAGMQLLVDMAAASSPEWVEVASGGAVEVAAITGGVGGPVAAGAYGLAEPIIHNADCPGQYLMGLVLDYAGAPTPGVTIKLRDQWGNQASAVSKSGAADFGRFDFPIPSSSPHELYLWVVDGAGNQISPTITIQHRQGDAPDVPCHHLVLRGG
jgi:penicillin-binding protein 1C